MVRTPGVGNGSGAGSSTVCPAESSTGENMDEAFSMLAAYSHSGQRMIRSSPLGDGQMNSVESEPPIEPLEAATGMAGMLMRSNDREYASRCRRKETSSSAGPTSKL